MRRGVAPVAGRVPDGPGARFVFTAEFEAEPVQDAAPASETAPLAGLFAFSLINLKLLEKGAHYER